MTPRLRVGTLGRIRVAALLGLALVILLVAAVSLELAARSGGRATVLEADAVFAPNVSGWCGAARLETDEQGQRRGASSWLSQPLGRSLVVVGGAFTAGAGLEDEELFAARLEPHARVGGFDRVVSLVVPAPGDDKLELARRAHATAGRNDVLVLELDGRDLGADPTPFEIAAPARRLEPVVASSSAALTWFEVLNRRRLRARFESEITELVARDGFTGRAAARSNLRLEALTKAASTKRLDADQSRLLQAWLVELHGLEREEERAERLAAWTAFFEAARRDARALVVLITGATPPTLPLGQLARDLAFPVVHAPPFELDPDLRIDAPFPRAAAVVHAQAADTLWAVLTRRGILTGDAAAPERVLNGADAIEQAFVSRGGFDESAIVLARAQIDVAVEFANQQELPLGVVRGIVRGVEPGFRIVPERAAEIVLRRPSLPRKIVVRAVASAASPPRIALRTAVDGGSADPERVEDVAVAPDRALYEWRFRPPAPRRPIDHPALEFSLLPAIDGAPPTPIELRDVRYLVEE